MFAKFSSSFLTTFKGRLDSEAVLMHTYMKLICTPSRVYFFFNASRSARHLNRQDCTRLTFPNVSLEKGQLITVPKATHSSDPHNSPMMPSESACRNLAGRINEQAGDNTQAGAFLFGVFNLAGIREFRAIHEVNSIASQVYVREFY